MCINNSTMLPVGINYQQGYIDGFILYLYYYYIPQTTNSLFIIYLKKGRVLALKSSET